MEWQAVGIADRHKLLIYPVPIPAKAQGWPWLMQRCRPCCTKK